MLCLGRGASFNPGEVEKEKEIKLPKQEEMNNKHKDEMASC